MQIDRSASPDLIERIGIVIWKIAVLVIALRFALTLIPQHGVLDGLGVGSMVLQGCALVLVTTGGIWAAIQALRARGSWLARPGRIPKRPDVARPFPQADTSRALTAAQALQHLMWRGSSWMLALGLESMLAAQIIQVSIASAEQNDLSWGRMSVVAIIALSRILM